MYLIFSIYLIYRLFQKIEIIKYLLNDK